MQHDKSCRKLLSELSAKVLSCCKPHNMCIIFHLLYLNAPFLERLTFVNTCTVESRYLELGYLEFCETLGVFLNQKYIFIAFYNHNLVLICTSGNFELVKNSPHNLEISRVDCILIVHIYTSLSTLWFNTLHAG